jgi:hypothetical protein
MAQIGEEQWEVAVTFMIEHYHGLLKDLKGGVAVKKRRIKSLFHRDPLLEQKETGNGHSTYQCPVVEKIKFGTVDHGPGDITSGVRKDLIKSVQIYINVFKLFPHRGKKLADMNSQDWGTLYVREARLYEIYAKPKEKDHAAPANGKLSGRSPR